MLKDIPTSRLQEITDIANSQGIDACCTICKVSSQTIARYKRELNKRKDFTEGVAQDVRTKDQITQTIISTKKFTTVKDLAEFCEIDLDVWEADKITTNQWNTAAHFTCWQFKVNWKRINTMTADIFKRIVTKYMSRDKYVLFPTYPIKQGTMALEVNIPDLHLGRQVSAALHKEYNMQLAHDVYMDAMNYFYQINKQKDIEKVVLLMGSDFMNVDTTSQTTTHGTMQEEEASYKDSFDMAIVSAIDAIELWRSKGYMIEIKMIPGNHDKQRVYALGCVLTAQYRDIDSVVIDNNHLPRKYFVYGVNLIGFSHGKEDYKRLKSVYQVEMRKYMSQCTNIEFHCGHTHQEKVVEDFGSVIIRTVPSLAENSNWEIEGGYRGNRRAQAFLYQKQQGLLAIEYYSPDYNSLASNQINR